MAELENKMKKEADVREEQLLKRISEKDKQISKMKWVDKGFNEYILMKKTAAGL